MLLEDIHQTRRVPVIDRPVANIFRGVVNRMESGFLLREIVNKGNAIHFGSTEEIHTLSHLYESMLKEMRDAKEDFVLVDVRNPDEFEICVIDEPDDRLAVQALAETLAPMEPEIVHNHMYRAEVVGTRAALLLGEKGCKRPAVISTIHSSRIRCVDDRHALRQLTPLMDRLIVVSKAIEQKIRDEGRVGAPVSLIYNGVDLQRYNHQQPCCTLHDDYSIPESAPIVGVVARLEAEKGHRTLIDAWPLVLAAHPEAWLLVVGEGSERNSLEAQAASLGVANRVVFTGRREDVPAVTAALDISVLPSYREAQGLSVLEAMALGRPVVGSEVGGIPVADESFEELKKKRLKLKDGLYAMLIA